MQESSEGNLVLQSGSPDAMPRSGGMLWSVPHEGESPESVGDPDPKVDLTYTQKSGLVHTSTGEKGASDGFTGTPDDRTDTGAPSDQTLPTGSGPGEVQRTTDEGVITPAGVESGLPLNGGGLPSLLASLHTGGKVPTVSKQDGTKFVGVGTCPNPEAVEHMQESSGGSLVLQSGSPDAIPRSGGVLSSMPHEDESPESAGDPCLDRATLTAALPEDVLPIVAAFLGTKQLARMATASKVGPWAARLRVHGGLLLVQRWYLDRQYTGTEKRQHWAVAGLLGMVMTLCGKQFWAHTEQGVVRVTNGRHINLLEWLTRGDETISVTEQGVIKVTNGRHINLLEWLTRHKLCEHYNSGLLERHALQLAPCTASPIGMETADTSQAQLPVGTGQKDLSNHPCLDGTTLLSAFTEDMLLLIAALLGVRQLAMMATATKEGPWATSLRIQRSSILQVRCEICRAQPDISFAAQMGDSPVGESKRGTQTTISNIFRCNSCRAPTCDSCLHGFGGKCRGNEGSPCPTAADLCPKCYHSDGWCHDRCQDCTPLLPEVGTHYASLYAALPYASDLPTSLAPAATMSTSGQPAVAAARLSSAHMGPRSHTGLDDTAHLRQTDAPAHDPGPTCGLMPFPAGDTPNDIDNQPMGFGRQAADDDHTQAQAVAGLLWSIADVINTSTPSVTVVQERVERMILALGLSTQSACKVAIRKRRFIKPWVDAAIMAEQGGKTYEMPKDVEAKNVEEVRSVQCSQGLLRDYTVEQAHLSVSQAVSEIREDIRERRRVRDPTLRLNFCVRDLEDFMRLLGDLVSTGTFSRRLPDIETALGDVLYEAITRDALQHDGDSASPCDSEHRRGPIHSMLQRASSEDSRQLLGALAADSDDALRKLQASQHRTDAQAQKELDDIDKAIEESLMEHALRMSMQDTHEMGDGSEEERSNAPRVPAEEAQRGYMRAIGARRMWRPHAWQQLVLLLAQPGDPAAGAAAAHRLLVRWIQMIKGNPVTTHTSTWVQWSHRYG